MNGPLEAASIRQVGYLVANLDQAVQDAVGLGVRSWTRFSVSPGGTFADGPSTGEIDIALGYSAGLQVELIEAVGPGYSVWHRDRDASRFGIHHVALWREDYDHALSDLAATGTIVQRSDAGLARFAYVEAGSGLLIELMELTPLSREFMEGAGR